MAAGNVRTAKRACSSPRVSIIYRSIDDLKLDPKNPGSTGLVRFVKLAAASKNSAS